MGKFAISYILVVLLLGLLLGSVAGSLADRLLGFTLFDLSLTGKPLRILENFYLIQILEIRLTPAGLLGLVIAGFFLYRKGGE